MIRGLIFVLAGQLFWGLPALGQFGFGEQVKIPKDLARFESVLQPDIAHPGENLRLIITARLSQGWYTYSAVAQGELAPPPTKLTVQAGSLTTVGPLYETNPTIKVDKVFDLRLAYHPGAARFYQNLVIPKDHPGGSAELSARLRYQVCNNKLCTPPRTEEIVRTVTVAPGPVRPAFAYPERTIDYLDDAGKFYISADTLEQALAGGALRFILLAAGFGLLALLTPCVFPMIPVTVSFFTGAQSENPRRATLLALYFGAGIVATYTGLGLLLTFLLGASGVNQFAANPWVNLAVAGFFVLFALVLMGVFEMRLPGGMVQGLSMRSHVVKGPLGVLVMGVAFTATSFTCTAPFVGTLLVAATQGEVLWPLLGMLVFSLVFAFPFVLLALFPKMLAPLRGKSGAWLLRLKVVLGLVELMAALKFISNADLIWQWGIFNRAVLLGSWVVLALLIATVVAGMLPWPGIGRGTSARPLLRSGLALPFLALALYLGLGLLGQELDAYTESYLPPDLAGGGPLLTASGELLPPEKVDELPWLESLDAALPQAQASGKPIFIDFTGYTCINCRWMEKKIFAEKTVFEIFRDQFILVKLYTDGGARAEANQALQIERFQTVALPYYVILGPDNTVLARHAGIIPDPGRFLQFLARARDRG